MFESRCGECCSSCERKEKVKCKGCINMTTTFWGGRCEVKTCCEDNGYNHCGECCIFPCSILVSTGKEQGYDPLTKVEQCKRWMQEASEDI